MPVSLPAGWAAAGFASEGAFDATGGIDCAIACSTCPARWFMRMSISATMMRRNSLAISIMTIAPGSIGVDGALPVPGAFGAVAAAFVLWLDCAWLPAASFWFKTCARARSAAFAMAFMVA